MSDLNVYLLESTSDNLSYGDTDSAVVVAVDVDDARRVMFEANRRYEWFHPTEVTITVIAENPIGERGIILTHEIPN